MDIQQLKNIFIQRLASLYDEVECINLMYWTLQELTKLKKSNLLAQKNIEVSVDVIENILSQLQTGKPIQYVFNKAYLGDLELYVDENVLIPRPETEELVDWIIKDSEQSASINIIDLCTGSGCIALGLKKSLSNCKISAIDIDKDAIVIAQKNATINKLEINFLQQNIFTFQTSDMFEIIVSNPPYVRASEKILMHQNVLNFEPHLALFVENNDALLFYKTIAEFALKNLKPQGKIYLEINEGLAIETQNLFEEYGFNNIIIKKDLNEKDRMMRILK